MMKKLVAKIKSNTGASLILVLVLFFMCVMVSSVVVATAAAGAGRNSSREKQQQGYLSITSAVELIIAEMENSGKFVGKQETADYGCNETGAKQYSTNYYLEVMNVAATPKHSDITETSGEDIWTVDNVNTALTGALKPLLLEACTKIYDAKQTEYTTSFVISSDDSRLVDVNCDFSIDETYNLTMKFTAADTNYSMTLKFAGNKAESTEPAALSCSHSITYTEIKADGSMESNVTGSRELEGAKTIKRTTITWGLPSVVKGVN